MTRLSRLRQSLLFITISFMSYLGLICQVQVRLPTTTHTPPQHHTGPVLDFQHTSALQRTAAEDNHYEHSRQLQTELVGGNETGDHTSVSDEMAQDVDSEQEDRVFNSTDNKWLDSGRDSPSQAQYRPVEFVPVGQKFVFGAYLDLRQKGNMRVRLLVLQRRKDSDGLVCFVHSRERNYTLYAQPYRLCENHGKEFEGWMYSYLLPDTMSTLPQRISVAPLHNRHTHNNKNTTTLTLKVIPPHTEQTADNIGVCVPPLFGHLNLASLIHFLQMCRVLGADRVFMYMGTVSSEIRKFLIHRSKTDASLSVVDWNLPDNVSSSGDKLWYHGQLLAIQDCLYHNMASFRFLLFIDLDEMLVPRLSHSWPHMLSTIFAKRDRHSVAALTFKSVFFDPTRVPRDWENIVYFQHLHRTVSASRVRHKLMVQPMKVFELGIHHLSKSLSEQFISMEVSETVAVIHHYHECDSRYERDLKCDLVTEDRSMLRYKDRLTHLSHRVITDASKLFA